MTAGSVFSSSRRRLPLVASAVIGFANATAACRGGSSQAGVASLGTTTIAQPAATGAAGARTPEEISSDTRRACAPTGSRPFPTPIPRPASSTPRPASTGAPRKSSWLCKRAAH
jgi:hypothetical protein